MTRLSLLVVILAGLVSSAAATASQREKSHSLRHAEQSVVVLSKPPSDDAVAAEPVQVRVPSSELQLVGSMGSLLEDEEEVMDPKSPKAELQRKLVALIWLERVMQQNLDSMDEDAYRAKIAKSKTGLEKDTSPATAEMLSKMRGEMHEFSVPFFQNAVKAELKDIRERQKVLLDKIIALDSGLESAELATDDKEGGDATQKEKKDKKEKKKPAAGDDKGKVDEKKRKNRQSNIAVTIMSVIGGTLILIVLGIAIKVHTHTSSSRA